MAAVMFSVETSTSPSWVAQRGSAERSAAKNPRTIRLLSFEDSSPKQDSRQWWFVIISPSGETNEAVQLVNRTVERRT